MTLKDYLLAQLDREAALTRKAIERFPEGHDDFKPHERSMPFGYLASLVASMPGWIPFIVDHDELDFDDPKYASFRTKALDSKAEMLAKLDDGLAEARRSLEATNDDHLAGSWGFKNRNITFPKVPRHIAIAESVFSHLAHHRGQLTVYLRLNEATVPALYGPSADEKS